MLLLALLACVSLRNGQGARPLGAGRTELGLDGGLLLVRAEEGTVSLPAGNLSVRHGLGERVDLLGELGLMGVGAGVKVTLTPPDAPGVAVALAPRLSAGTVIVASSVQASLPLLVGVPLGPHELTLAPRVDWARASLLGGAVGGPLAAVDGWMLGGTVGARLDLGSVCLVPELGVGWPGAAQATWVGETSEETGALGVVILQPNLFLLIDTGGGS